MTNLPANSPLVIDSNVWISALVFGGKPRQLFEQVVQRGITIAVSAPILEEVRRNMQRKFPEFLEDFEELLIVLSSHLQYVTLGSISISVCRDPDDDKIIETAILSQASTIVSGDKDLLSLSRYESIEILRPGEFLVKS